MDLKPLFEKHKHNHAGQDVFAVVMIVIGGIGLGIAIASYLYVKSKYSRFTDTKYSGVKMITTSMASNETLEEVNRHYVVVPGGTNTIDIYIKLGIHYPENTYVSFYQPFPLCGQANDAVSIPTGPRTNIYLNVPSESSLDSYSLWNNYGVLLVVVDDLGISKWKVVRIWSLDLSTTGQTSM